MAYASETNLSTSLTSPVSGIFSAILNGLVALAERDPRYKRIQVLAELSDEELAAKGLRRQDIARHVMQGRIWI